MLQNAYFLAKIGADTAENEQHFAEILPTDALWRLRLSQEDRSTMYKLEGLSSGRYVYVGSKMNAIDLELELEVLRFF